MLPCLLRLRLLVTVSQTSLVLVAVTALRRIGHVYGRAPLSGDLPGVFLMAGLGVWVLVLENRLLFRAVVGLQQN